jgi:pilus assembly protein Flp/PilA
MDQSKRPVRSDPEWQAIKSRVLSHFYSGENSMSKILTATRKFVREEEGASLVEYAMLLALICVICIAGVTALGTNISSMFTNLGGLI